MFQNAVPLHESRGHPSVCSQRTYPSLVCIATFLFLNVSRSVSLMLEKTEREANFSLMEEYCRLSNAHEMSKDINTACFSCLRAYSRSCLCALKSPPIKYSSPLIFVVRSVSSSKISLKIAYGEDYDEMIAKAFEFFVILIPIVFSFAHKTTGVEHVGKAIIPAFSLSESQLFQHLGMPVIFPSLTRGI
ncbi:hypothetical protein AVEN_214063-1 [Araneus ventricosus]|uniref:Uncharacterized protein n=1 Tax=Araneus ventricosus TaxID=182803 RepID=A0A4Y2A3H1_ARAVE|nr:hypothetical protein AVEN_105802-1 [Araneus ventricosus]GBL73915.1 hypothetical protein AVEN_214063-1 [Araneus ventricosus]